MLTTFLLFCAIGAEPRQRPKPAPRPAARAPVAIKDLANEIDDAIDDIDRTKLTAAQADAQLDATVAAFNKKRYSSVLRYKLEDVERNGEYASIRMIPLDDGIQGISGVRWDVGSLGPLVNANKGQEFTLSGMVQVCYVNGNTNNQNAFQVGTSTNAKLYLVGMKIALVKPKPEEKK
ncbi:MAG: hypothetical protein K8T91_20090 [Planctomycetes bacterium]|nr:hypothetical protein [Planctomycetota bacterium]